MILPHLNSQLAQARADDLRRAAAARARTRLQPEDGPRGGGEQGGHLPSRASAREAGRFGRWRAWSRLRAHGAESR